MGTEPPLLACRPLRRWTALLLLSFGRCEGDARGPVARTHPRCPSFVHPAVSPGPAANCLTIAPAVSRASDRSALSETGTPDPQPGFTLLATAR